MTAAKAKTKQRRIPLVDLLPPFARRARGWLTDTQREALIDALSAKMTAQERADFIWHKETQTKYDKVFGEIAEAIGWGWGVWSIAFDEQYLREIAFYQIERDCNPRKYYSIDLIISRDGEIGAVLFRARLPMVESAAFRAVAKEEGLSPHDLRLIIDSTKLAAGETLERKATGKATARATAEPRTKKANPQLTIVRLKAAYEVLVRDSNLVNPSLSDDERMSRAIHLRKTYSRLRKFDPSFHDNSEQLRVANKLLNDRAQQRRNAKKLAA